MSVNAGGSLLIQAVLWRYWRLFGCYRQAHLPSGAHAFIPQRLRGNADEGELTMNEVYDAEKTVDRNKIALVMSVIPGLGLIYKRHYLSGFGILIAGNALAILTTGMLTLTTLGLALIIVPAAWYANVAYSAYTASDKHGQHRERFRWWDHAATG